MYFSKSCEYALRAVMYLAKFEQEQRVGIKLIAKELDLPAEYLSKILQLLARQGIVSSVKGRNGGFFLSNNELNKPLIKIVQAIDGKDVFNKCGLGMAQCSKKKPCPLHNEIKKYRDSLQVVLTNTSIGSTREGVLSGATFLSR